MTPMTNMMRTMLSFFSMLALGVMTLAVIALLFPVVQARVGAQTWMGGGALESRSAFLGLAVGLLLGFLNRYNWGDLPRRIVTWFLVRERQLFYYIVIAVCIGVLLFY